MPKVAGPGVPTRIPEAVAGGSGSNGIAFLLSAIPTRSHVCSASAPVTPTGCRSTRARCESVPPDTGRNPSSASAFARARAPRTVRAAYSRNPGSVASFNATAFAAMACSSGPPCIIGNTALSMAFACSSRHRIIAPRGPRKVLCVVNVTTSACGTGLGYAPPATSPMKCAASTMKMAPTSSATCRNAAKSITRGYAVKPARMMRGRCSMARSRTRSMSISSVSLSTSYATNGNHLPEKFTGEPWVRWPPWGNDRPRTFRSASLGSRNAPNTAMFACAPACGCTFA